MSTEDSTTRLSFQELLRQLEAEYARQRAVAEIAERENEALRLQLGVKQGRGKRQKNGGKGLGAREFPRSTGGVDGRDASEEESEASLPFTRSGDLKEPSILPCPDSEPSLPLSRRGNGKASRNGLRMERLPMLAADTAPDEVMALSADEMCQNRLVQNSSLGSCNFSSESSGLAARSALRKPETSRSRSGSFGKCVHYDTKTDSSDASSVRKEVGETVSQLAVCSRDSDNSAVLTAPKQHPFWEQARPRMKSVRNPTTRTAGAGSSIDLSGVINKSMMIEKATGQTIMKSQGCISRLVVRPNAPHRLFWDLLSMIMISYDVVMIPIDLCFEMPTFQFIQSMDIATSSFWLLDIPCNFLTGFHAESKVEMRIKSIAMNYLRGFFFLDFLVVSVEWFVLISGWLGQYTVDSGCHNSASSCGSSTIAVARIGKTVRITRVFRAFRLIRFVRLSRIIHEFYEIVNNEYMRQIYNVLVSFSCIIICNHYFACVWWAVGLRGIKSGIPNWIENNPSPIYPEPWSYHYFTSLHWSLTQFTPAGMEARPFNVYERIYSIMVLLVAIATFSSFLGTITATMTQLRKLHNESTQQEHVLRRYFKDNRVSTDLSQRIWRHLKLMHFRHRNRSAKRRQDEAEVLKLLPGALRKSLSEELYRPYIVHLPFFFHYMTFSDTCLRDICDTAFDDKPLAIADEVFQDGNPAETMYFISVGQLRYRHQLVELNVKLRPGQWVCEPALWLEWTYYGKLQAITTSEVIELKAPIFREVIEKTAHPILLQFAKSYASRFCKYVEGTEFWQTDVWSETKVLHQLCAETTDEFESNGRRSFGPRRSSFTRMATLGSLIWRSAEYHGGTPSYDAPQGPLGLAKRFCCCPCQRRREHDSHAERRGSDRS